MRVDPVVALRHGESGESDLFGIASDAPSRRTDETPRARRGRQHCLLAFGVAAGAEQTPPPGSNVDMQWGVKIPMRDGVTLNATIYRPKGQKEGLPAVFTLTPYISDTYHERALYFARRGYVFALVDVRGRGNSGGVYEPFANDARDGHDVVEWLAKQPWCNGKVAMWGGSYAGFDQWATLKELPPHLATIVPAAPRPSRGRLPVPVQHLLPLRHAVADLTGGDRQRQPVRRGGVLEGQGAASTTTSAPAFRELDKLVGNPSPIFQKWLEHPTPDAYYDAMVPTAEQYAALSLPILTITGHYDGDQPGAFVYYDRHMQYGTPGAKRSTS